MAGLFQQLFGGANTAGASASADAGTTTQSQNTAPAAPATQPTQQAVGTQQAVAAPQGTDPPRQLSGNLANCTQRSAKS